jgi:hypothetical protein
MKPANKNDVKMLTEAYSNVVNVNEGNLWANVKAGAAGFFGSALGVGEIAKLKSLQKSINAKLDTTINDVTALLKSNNIPFSPQDITALKTSLNQFIETNLIQKIAPSLNSQQQQAALQQPQQKQGQPQQNQPPQNLFNAAAGTPAPAAAPAAAAPATRPATP